MAKASFNNSLNNRSNESRDGWDANGAGGQVSDKLIKEALINVHVDDIGAVIADAAGASVLSKGFD